MMKRRRAISTAAAAALLMLTAACGGGGGDGAATTADADSSASADASSAPEDVRIVLPADSAIFWDVYIADQEGFFKKRGVTPEITLTPGPAATIAAMSGGGADVGVPFAEQALAAMEKGAPLSIFAGEFNRIMATLIGQKGVTQASQLKGKKVASSNVDDIVTLIVMDELEKAGLNRDDYDRIIVGASGQRYQSLQSGAVAASSLTAPIDRQALREGYSQILNISQPGLLTAHIGTKDFLKNRQEAARRYVLAIQDSIDWLLDPKNEARALEILVAKAKVTEADAKATYDLYIGEEAFVRGAAIDEEALSVPLTFLKETGRVTAIDPKKYIDRRALEAAEKSGS
jgi:ABC-type nitrate/sulfonate/bicarbonate transport system substrate-binding protein